MDFHFQKYTEILIAKHIYLLLVFLMLQRQKLLGLLIVMSSTTLKNCTMKNMSLIKV